MNTTYKMPRTPLALSGKKIAQTSSALALVDVHIPKVKARVLHAEYSQFLTELADVWDGYSHRGEMDGFWRDRSTGIEHLDTHIVIGVAIPNDQSSLDVLNNIVAETARDLKEISIFIAISAGATYFVFAKFHGNPGDDLW